MRIRVAVVVIALLPAACGGGGGSGSGGSTAPGGEEEMDSLAPRAEDELAPGPRKHTTCSEAINRVEDLAGDLDRGLTAGPIAGFESLTSRVAWLEACPRFSPWVRRCLYLSTSRAELTSCEPGNEPWSREHDIAGPSAEDRAAFEDCVDRARDRRELARCQY